MNPPLPQASLLDFETDRQQIYATCLFVYPLMSMHLISYPPTRVPRQHRASYRNLQIHLPFLIPSVHLG